MACVAAVKKRHSLLAKWWQVLARTVGADIIYATTYGTTIKVVMESSTPAVRRSFNPDVLRDGTAPVRLVSFQSSTFNPAPRPLGGSKSLAMLVQKG